eukprot:1560412-Pyramimonas_sp.AAC.1
MIRGMSTIRKTSHISNIVEGLPYVRTTSDGFTYENNQWVLGRAKNRHGPHWPSARALAKLIWTDVLRVS